MATTAGSPVFVDTNVLVYTSLPTSPMQAVAELALNALAGSGVELWISRQILREWIATLTRPGVANPPIPLATVLADVGPLAARFSIAEDSPAVFAELLAVLGVSPCGGRQVYDANIVATMLAHGIPNLLTHNTADFNRFSGYITVIPLVPPPGGP